MGNLEIDRRSLLRFILGMEDTQRLAFVAGMKASLLTRSIML